MFGFNKKKTSVSIDIKSPVDGQMINIEDVPDKVFASKMMGPGCAFIYDDDEVCAPVDGKITLVANTLHAFGMTGENGVEILVHIGLDTVNLNGSGFKQLVKQGTKVKAGTPIIKIDRNFMKEKNITLTTPLVITNSDDYNVEVVENKEVTRGKSIVLTVKKK